MSRITDPVKWEKVEAGVYVRRTGLRTHLRAVARMNSAINGEIRWHLSEVTEGEKAWQRPESVREIDSFKTLRDLKLFVKLGRRPTMEEKVR